MNRVILFAILLCSGLFACSDRQASTALSNKSISPASSEPATTEAAQSRAASDTGGGGGGGRTDNADANRVSKQNISLAQTSASAVDTLASDRKIIRNAELNLEAESPEEAQRRITTIAEIKGGFVVESQQSSSDLQATSLDIVAMTVRVPAARFNDALDEIRGTSTRVVTETVIGQDVTEEFIDIEAQLKAKKALEEQFMAIMKRANTVEDALDVQRQLADVRGEIERVEGRKRFLENQSSLSTIKIRLQTAKVFAEASAGFGARLTEAFSSGLGVALNFVLGLVTILVAALPFAVFIGLPFVAFIRYVLRRQSRRKSVTEIAEEEIRSS